MARHERHLNRTAGRAFIPDPDHRVFILWAKTMDQGELIGRIYEAGALPDLWPDVLTELERVGEGDGSLMFTQDRDDFRFVASQRGAPIATRYMEEGWASRTDRVARLFSKERAGFVTDLEIYTREEIDREPVYTEFLRNNGLGWGAATAVVAPSGERMVVSVERAHARGPVPSGAVRRLNALRPHLARAVTLSTRLAMRSARAAAEALEMIGTPAAVIGRNGRIIASNGSFDALARGLVQRGGHLTLLEENADRLVQAAIAGIARDDATSVRSIPVRGRRTFKPVVLHLVPIRRAAADVFGSAIAIAFATQLSPLSVPSGTVLEGLFDLTPAEARIAKEIARCQTVAEIAASSGTSPNTVRVQLRSVMEKTGISRQAELVALLSAISIPFK